MSVGSAKAAATAATRCAPRADARHDQMLGTAFPAARLLLVEQPFPWGPEGLRTSRFDRGAALALEARGRAEGVRVQAIRRLRRIGCAPEPARRTWFAVDTRTGVIRRGDFLADDELAELPLDGSGGEAIDDPLYLVCTHGRHDPCCGQRGRPLALALAEHRPDAVWQASHLGGCRFAPTVLALPLGLMYGRVPVTEAGRLIAATEAGEVAPGGLLRGRIGIPPDAQAALAFALDQLGRHAVADVRVVSVTTRQDGRVVVALSTKEGAFEVVVRRERVDAAGLTCAHPGPSWFAAHHPESITPVAGRS